MTLGLIQNNREVVITYAGRNLNPAVKKFQPYLYGKHFIVHTDHHALKWLMSIKDLTGRLARWSLFIQQFDFEIKHRPGTAST